MADYYFDSSALVKRYINETGSTWVGGLFDSGLEHEAFIGAITPVEIVAAIARRARGKTSPRAILWRLVLSCRPTFKPIIRLWKDPVVAEVRKIREDHAAFGLYVPGTNGRIIGQTSGIDER